METIKIEKDEDFAEVLKCKTDEILFVRYDSKKHPEATSELLNAIYAYCSDFSIPCLIIPLSDDEVFCQLEQWELDRLRNLDSKIQSIIRKKSPLILE